VKEAHRLGRKVAAHAYGYTIPGDALKLMAETRVFLVLVPTDAMLEAYEAFQFKGDTLPWKSGSSSRPVSGRSLLAARTD